MCFDMNGLRFAVYAPYDGEKVQRVFLKELGCNFGRKLVFEYIAEEELAQYGAAAFVAEYEAQWRHVGGYALAVVEARVGTCTHDACYPRLMAAQGAGRGEKVGIYLDFLSPGYIGLDGACHVRAYFGRNASCSVEIHLFYIACVGGKFGHQFCPYPRAHFFFSQHHGIHP